MTSPSAIHLGSTLDSAVLDSLADFICGDNRERYPTYRTGGDLARFFQTIGINVTHDGSTRKWWTLGILEQLDSGGLEKVILRLVEPREYKGDRTMLGRAFRAMNEILAMENLGVGFVGTTPELRRAKPIEFDADELAKVPPATDEAAFLGKQFSDVIRIDELGLDAVISNYLQARIDEVQACPESKVPLGTIILLGSTLEGLLLALALKHPATFMSSSAAPKDRQGSTKKLHDWTLSELINVAREIKLLDLDVSKFSHVLRDFRNYIHPYQQMAQAFSPDRHTVAICWQVFKAAFSQMKERTPKVLGS